MDRDSSTPTPPARPCPICGKPAIRGHRPFCSLRCSRIDLGRWLNGDYRIPAEDDPDDPPDGEQDRD